MQRKKYLATLVTALIIVMATLTWASSAAASSYKILHRFSVYSSPQGNLIFDAAGNLYGTTTGGGGLLTTPASCSSWRLNPDGTWTGGVLHRFTDRDGRYPSAPLIFDAAGNLYGTTQLGGTGGGGERGVVFKLAPNPDGTWTESVLHEFAGFVDGCDPLAGLVFDGAGNLYGTAAGCYGGMDGVIFKLAPNPDGTWTESVLYSFGGGPDGATPTAGLTFDAAGNLYGTTDQGGAYGSGVVFKLAPNPDGTWTEIVLYTFTGGADGANPYAGLIFDAAGNLYGTTSGGGAAGYGVVFKLRPHLDGTWTERVLHSFIGFGKYPYAPVIFDPAGNLYGTTTQGTNNYGLVFEITP